MQIKSETAPESVDLDLPIPPSQALNVPFPVTQEPPKVPRAVNPPKHGMLDEDILVERRLDVSTRDLLPRDADLPNAAERNRREGRREYVDDVETCGTADGNAWGRRGGALVRDDSDGRFAAVGESLRCRQKNIRWSRKRGGTHVGP